MSAVVRDRTHDEISVALHDNDYDPQRAAASLLDEDQEKAAVGGVCGVEWSVCWLKCFLGGDVVVEVCR